MKWLGRNADCTLQRMIHRVYQKDHYSEEKCCDAAKKKVRQRIYVEHPHKDNRDESAKYQHVPQHTWNRRKYRTQPLLPCHVHCIEIAHHLCLEYLLSLVVKRQ